MVLRFLWRFPLEIRFRLGKCTVFDLRHFNGTNSPRTFSIKTKNLWSGTISCLYILIINTRCRIVALSAVVNFMIVEVLNDKELPNNRVCKETQFSSKDGWNKYYYSCAFPPGFLIIQYYFLGKICIGKVELLSYKKKYLSLL